MSTNSLVEGIPAVWLSLRIVECRTAGCDGRELHAASAGAARSLAYAARARARSWPTDSADCVACDGLPRRSIRPEPRTQPRSVVCAFRLSLANTEISCEAPFK